MLRRAKLFFVLTFLVAATSVVYLVHYSTRTVTMKIENSGVAGKYFEIIKEKLKKGEDLNSIKGQLLKDLYTNLERHTNLNTTKSLAQTKLPLPATPAGAGAKTNLATAATQKNNIALTNSPEAREENSEDPVDKLIKKSLKNEKEKAESSEGDEDAETKPSETGGENPTDVDETEAEAAKPSALPEEDEDKELCPQKSNTLVGPLFVDQNVPKLKELEKHFSEAYGGWVKQGGAWKPTECKARTKVALIVPFRKRHEQLGIFVRHMHPLLKRQNVEYRILIIEQSGDTPFNRAILFNIGYKEALKLNNFDCFIFHDVDLIPEDDRNEYSCPTSPRHMSVAVDKFNYHLPYAAIFGGAGSFKKKDFEDINGFSNKFWGWGGEDDDLYQRITAKGFHLTRPSLQIGRYKMIRLHHHQSSKADPNRFNLLQNVVQRMPHDGLNTLAYKVLEVVQHPLYTIASIHVEPSMIKR